MKKLRIFAASPSDMAAERAKVETVAAMHPFYVIRAFGGIMFLVGALIMVYNLWRTTKGDVRVEKPYVTAPTRKFAPAAE